MDKNNTKKQQVPKISGNGKLEPYELSYDAITKLTLSKDNAFAVRFINGLFNGSIPLESELIWLDKEYVTKSKKRNISDFRPRLAGRMYSLEIEQDDRDPRISVRVMEYDFGGAFKHNTEQTGKDKVVVTMPNSCLIYLKSGRNAPKKLTYEIRFPDNQTVVYEVPTIRLGELTIKEIAERDLFAIGQFYLRTFEPITKANQDDFNKAIVELTLALKEAVTDGKVPLDIGLEMQDTIRKTAENAMIRSKEADIDMQSTVEILETIPWIDYSEAFEQQKLETQKEFALNSFRGADASPALTIKFLRAAGVPDDVIRNAQAEAAQYKQPKQRSDRDVR
jgi:hypothetical protein